VKYKDTIRNKQSPCFLKGWRLNACPLVPFGFGGSLGSAEKRVSVNLGPSIGLWQRFSAHGGVEVGHTTSFRCGGMVRGVVLMLLSVILVAGCEGILTKRKLNADDYKLAVEAFNDGIRWRDYHQAVSYVAPQQMDAFWKLADAIQERIRVYDYQIQKLDWNQQARSAVVLLRYRFYHPNDPSIYTKDLHQKWIYDDQHGNWRVTQTGLHVLLESGF
jgi:hypothetical protein